MNMPNPNGQLRVLLADDNGIFMDSVRHLLSGHDWLQVVGRASHGAECLALVTEQRPDVVVVDLEMPDINGFEVTKRIRSLPDHPHVIIMSLYDEPEYREGGQHLGVYGYVSKAAVTTDLIPLLQGLFQEGVPRPV